MLSVSFVLCRVSSERGSSRYCFWSRSRSKSLAVQFVAHNLPVSPVAEAAVGAIRVRPVAGIAVGVGPGVVVAVVLGLSLGLALEDVAVGGGVGVVGVAVVVEAVGHGVVRKAAGVDQGGVSLGLPLAVVAGVAVVEELGVGLGHGGGHEAKEDESLHGDADWMLVSLVVQKTDSESH